MIERTVNSLSLWFFENLSEYKDIGHFISARVGGHSTPPWDSLNLSFNVGDDPRRVLKNRKQLAGAMGISLPDLTTAKQIHGSHVEIVSEPLRGKGSADYKGAIHATDAMVSQIPQICLMVLLADCVPIILYDPQKRAVGAVHAGWKGTLGSIGEKTVRVFQKRFGSSARDIIVGIGPSIGPCCYEVGPEVVSQVEQVFGASRDCVRMEAASGKKRFDLWTANLRQLVRAGIPEENIEIAKICTCDHPDLFFSYRQEKGRTGRFGAGIFLRPGPEDGFSL